VKVMLNLNVIMAKTCYYSRKCRLKLFLLMLQVLCCTISISQVMSQSG